MNPWIARNLAYRPIYWLRGEHVFAFQREVEAFNRLGAEEMANIQWRKLTSLLKHVSESNPFYRNLFQAHGLTAKSIQSYADFARVPILTKQMLRDRSSHMISEGRWRLSHRKTSGSTGIPTRLVKDRVATAYVEAGMYAVYAWHGIAVGDRQARVWGGALDTWGTVTTRAKDYILNRRRMVAFNLTAESCSKYYRTLMRFQPLFMYGLVNTMCEFGRILKESGIDPRNIGLKCIITTGEIQFPFHRSFLEDTFGCRVANEYGCTECGIIAFECRKGQLHQLNHNLYVEVVKSGSGTPAVPGESGEVVITELNSYALPLIRYKIGDLARQIEGSCECGVRSPLIGELLGRISDLIVTPDGKKVSPTLLSYSMPPGVLRFQAIQRTPSHIDVFLETDGRSSERLKRSILSRLEAHLGKALQIDIQIVDQIQADNARKFRYFVSEVEDQNRRQLRP